jgi:hypothetical protein
MYLMSSGEQKKNQCMSEVIVRETDSNNLLAANISLLRIFRNVFLFILYYIVLKLNINLKFISKYKIKFKNIKLAIQFYKFFL